MPHHAGTPRPVLHYHYSLLEQVKSFIC
jgi:hypothetical protein